MTENDARDEICRVGRSLYERGYVHATAGNISVHLDDGLLITPTDACLGFLEPGRLARLDVEGRQTGGEPASKTAVLHARIVAAARRFDAETRCVIHSHSTHCVALSLQAETDAAAGDAAATVMAARGAAPGELLPALTPYFLMKVGRVPLIDYHRPGAPEVADVVAEAIERYGARGTPLRAVMLARLGPNVWHRTPAAAMAVLEELEETARLWLACARGAEPLAEPQIDELRRVFGARW